jgi:transcription initiation factor TFIIIB Brf1 subunit/transcription initiation factor TFIIB
MTDHSRPEDELCSSCGSLPITNSFTGELVCSACGIVLERVETLTPEWRSLSPTDDRVQDGFPSSLLIHGTGLSTYIGASGSTQPQEQSSSEQEAIILLLGTTTLRLLLFTSTRRHARSRRTGCAS